MADPPFVFDPGADLRSLARPLGRKVLHRAYGLGNEALEALGRPPAFPITIADQWRRVLGRSRVILETMPPAGEPRVLFASVWGTPGAAQVIEATIAMALRLRGATPIVLACDKVLPACEWNPFGNFDPPPGAFGPPVTRRTRLERCRICMDDLDGSHGLPGLERVSFSEVLEPGDFARVEKVVDGVPYDAYRELVHRGIHVGEHAYASLMRATLRGTPLDDAPTRFLFRRYLVAAILVVELGSRVFDRVRPDRLVAVHGVYVTQGTLCELARSRGIHVVVYGTPYRKNTIWLCHGDTYHRALVTAPNDRWERLEMTPAREKIADEYLESKHVVPRDYASYHVNALVDEEQIRKEVGLDERPVVSLFTNVLWDALLYYRFNAFPNMLDWAFDTIRWFGERPDLQLVLRLHPAEARGAMPTNQPLLPEIEREFPKLPENVHVVAPESRVSSYALAKMSAAALIYGARIGVEIALLGTPVIVAGETFIRGKGFSFDASTREEYFDLLDRVKNLPRAGPDAMVRAKRWYYYYFFRLMMPFPFYSVDETVHMSNPRLRLRSLDELLPGRSPVLDLVCRGIADGETPFEHDEIG